MKEIFLLVSHTSVQHGGGPVHKLTEYLKKNHPVYIIQHPLYPKSITKSSIIISNHKISFKLPFFLQYLLEGIAGTIFLLFLNKKPLHVDVVICFDPLSFMNVYLFRFFIRYKKIIYYNMDFSINRFSNPILNIIYKKFNLYSFRKCTYFFYLSDNSVKYLDPEGKQRKKTFFVKHTTKIIQNKSGKKQNIIIYAGNISTIVDFNQILKALRKIKQEKIPFEFLIFGSERDKGLLRRLIQKYKISDCVYMKGSVDMNDLLTKFLPKSSIGISAYKTKGSNLPDYMFQGIDLTAKVVDYIACGLPVVSTKLTPAFDVIEKEQFGFLVKNTDEWYKSIKTLLTDKNILRRYSLNAKKYALRYSETKVFDPIINTILQR